MLEAAVVILLKKFHPQVKRGIQQAAWSS